MNWGSATEFFRMGGYGLYVWTSYGVTALFMMGELVLLWRKKKSLVERLTRMARADEKSNES